MGKSISLKGTKSPEQRKSFIHERMTDNQILDSMKQNNRIGEENKAFFSDCEDEMFWREQNNKHYTEEMQDKLIRDHHDKILRINGGKHPGVYIEPDYQWTEL